MQASLCLHLLLLCLTHAWKHASLPLHVFDSDFRNLFFPLVRHLPVHNDRENSAYEVSRKFSRSLHQHETSFAADQVTNQVTSVSGKIQFLPPPFSICVRERSKEDKRPSSISVFQSWILISSITLVCMSYQNVSCISGSANLAIW